MTTPDQITLKHELFRKLLHLASLSIPVLYALTDETITLLALVPVTFIVVVIDLVRSNAKGLNAVITGIFGNIMRAHESLGLTGASYLLLASCIVIAVFPKNIAITAMAVPAVGDVMAGLIGRSFGRIQFFSKTVEGTLAFIFSGTLVVYLIMNIFQLSLLFFVTGFAATCIASVVEAASKYLHIDDNFSVPIFMGLFMGVLL